MTSRAAGYRLVPPLLALAVLANSAMVPLMPYLLVSRSGWDLWQVGLYSFAVTAVTIVATRRGARRVDRGTSTVVLCAVGGVAQVLAAGCAIGALHHGGWLTLSIPMLALGGGTVPVFYVMGRRAATEAGKDISRYNSVLRMATSGGWVLGPAMSFAILVQLGPEATLGSVGVAAAVALVALLACASRLDARDVVKPGDPEQCREDPPDAAARRAVFSAVVLVSLLSFAHIATTTSLALLLVDHASVRESRAGALISSKALVEMCAILLAPWVLARWTPRGALACCSLLAVAAYAVYLVADGWATALLGTVLEGTYYGLFAAIGLTWVQSLAPDRMGWTTGAYMTGIYTGVLLGSPLSGFVAQLWLPAITVLSMCAACGAFLLAAPWRRQEVDSRPGGPA